MSDIPRARPPRAADRSIAAAHSMAEKVLEQRIDQGAPVPYGDVENEAAVGNTTALPAQPELETRQAAVSRHPDWVLAGRPGRGLRWLMWLLWTVLRLYKLSWIPQPRPYGLYAYRTVEMSHRLVAMRHFTQCVVAVVTTKGGACKTTVATWLSAFIAYILHLVVILFDTDSGGGKVLKRFGLDPIKAMTSTEIVERLGHVSYDELSRRTQTDPATGVVMIHSPAGREFGGDSLGVAAVNLHGSSHTLVIDCGPGFEKPNTNSAIRVADVIVIPARFESGDDLDDIQATLDHPTYRLREDNNIGRVIVSVSAVGWRYFNTRTQYKLARRFGLEPHQVVLIPFSRYLVNKNIDGGNAKPVDLGKLNPKMMFALALLNLRMAEVIQKHGRRKPPEDINTADRDTLDQPHPVDATQRVGAPS